VLKTFKSSLPGKRINMPKNISKDFSVSTEGENDIIDITDNVEEVVDGSGLGDGIVSIFVKGSTAGITTVEYEPGLVKDLKEAFEKIAPRRGHYHHEDMWHDGNGYAHVRASLLGSSQTFPVRKGKMLLGTWQQIILVDFDNKPRHRNITVNILGE